MAILKLYIETSIIGFYFDETEHNRTKREAVRKLFQQTKKGPFEGYVSPITIGEISDSPEPYRSRDLHLIEELNLLPLTIQINEVARLSELYVKNGILNASHRADLLHIAAAVLSSIDVVVSYNFAHIANERIARLVKSVNLKEGLRTEFSILPPEEVIFYED